MTDEPSKQTGTFADSLFLLPGNALIRDPITLDGRLWPVGRISHKPIQS